ncbi:hypothetical protein DFH06DRAFT_1323580 [Mycena polygramma]|nr:hypothetical protein DFH06DRAFT_1323580 [Mycena polygramma]
MSHNNWFASVNSAPIPQKDRPKLPLPRRHFPDEVWMIIMDLIAFDRDDARAVASRKIDRACLMRTSRKMASVCRATPSMWSNIAIQSPSAWHPFAPPTLAGLDYSLTRSCDQPLHIVFEVPVGKDPGNLGTVLWNRLKQIKFRKRWEGIYFIGSHTCSPGTTGYVCLHSMFVDLYTAPLLRTVVLQLDQGANKCSIAHSRVRLDVSQLQFLTSSFPVEIHQMGSPAVSSIISLDVPVESGIDWAVVFQGLTRLETLVWRSKNVTALPSVGSRTCLDRLRSLNIHSLVDLPPIEVPALTTLIISDGHHIFTSTIMASVVGSGSSLLTLDLLSNPIDNDSLAAVLCACPSLVYFRVSTAQVRTSAYCHLESRVTSGYLYNPDPSRRLAEVEFAGVPPNNSKRDTARRKFDQLARLGFQDGSRIRFHRDVFRVKVKGFPAPFRACLDSYDVKNLAYSNYMGDALVAVDSLDQTNCPLGDFPRFTLILVFSDEQVVNRILQNGVKFKRESFTVDSFKGAWNAKLQKVVEES